MVKSVEKQRNLHYITAVRDYAASKYRKMMYMQVKQAFANSQDIRKT